MEQPTHSNRRKIGVLSKPFWQRNNHARKSRSRHKCFTSQAESKRVTFHTSWIVSVNSNFWDPANSMAKILDILRTQKWLFLYDQIKLCLKNQAIQIENVLSKNIYSEIRAGYETTPTAQATFEEQFPDVCLDWHDIYKFEDKCCVVTHRAADIRVAWLVYLACLRSHVLRANCNFESKQANSITLFGRRPNEKESLNTARKWERRARISEVGFLWESLGWARIKCLLSALTNVHAVSIYQNLSETSMERSIEWRMCSIWHKFHSFMRSSPKFKTGSTDIAVNILELPVTPCENSWMEHAFSLEIFQRENRTTFLKFQLFPGTWYAQKTCVPLTSLMEFSEFLSKWKAPHITVKGKVVVCACSEFWFLFILSQNQTMWRE